MFVCEHRIVLLMPETMNGKAFRRFPTADCSLTSLQVACDLLPGLKRFLRRVSLGHREPSQKLYTEAHGARCLGMPVKRLLDNPPTLRHAEECEEIRHSDAGTCQLARPVCDLKPYHSNRLGDVHADNPRFNIGRRSISVDPVEQELNSDRELIADITKERGLRVEGSSHQYAVALLATVDVELKSFQNRVVFGLIFCGGHGETIRCGRSGQQRTKPAKIGTLPLPVLSPTRTLQGPAFVEVVPTLSPSLW